MGISFNVVDNNTYFSFMRQAREGHIFFSNMFTSEKVPYIIFNPAFLLIGWLTLLMPELAAYYLVKLVFLVLFILLVYKLVGLRYDKLDIGAYFILFGSGIGYIFIMLTWFGIKKFGSVDDWVVGANSMSIALAPVHFLISLVIMLLIVIYYYRFWEEKERKMSYFVIFSVCSFILAFIHLFDVMSLCGAFALFMLWRLIKGKENIKDILKYNLIYLAVLLIPIFYTFYLYGISDYFVEWNSQNLLQTPKLLHLAFGFLIPLGLSSYYLVRRINKLEDLDILMLSWAASSIILLYSPLNIQIRFIEGLNIPIMFMAGLGFLQFGKKQKIITVAILILIIPTSLYWIAREYTLMSANRSGDYSVTSHLSQDEIDAMGWLESKTGREDVVISSYNSGNYLPRVAGNRVFFGHWAQTLRFEDKKQMVDGFFTQDDAYRKGLIDEYGIKYVYYGPEEKELNKDFQSSLVLKKYSKNHVSVYEVI
jgi:hypothetical protein